MLLHLTPLVTQASATVQKQLQASLFPLLCHRRAVVRKRATLAIGNLACTTSTDQFHDMTMALLNEIEKKRKQQLQGATDEGEVLRTLMSCLTTFW